MNAKTYLCAVLLGASALTACRFEDDDYFDESPALRIQRYNAEVASLLCQPEHGWVMQYFYGDDVMGLNLFCQFFEDGSVRMAGNHQYMGNAYREDTSLWKMTAEDGPILALNTYNDVISYFGDPQNDGEGLGGDYQFLVLRASEDEVILRGQRHNAEVRLIPSPYADWQDYIAACKTTTTDILNARVQTYYLTNRVEDKNMWATGLSSGMLNVGPLLDYYPYAYNFVSTPQGIRFQRKMNFRADLNWQIDGEQEFFMNEDSTMLVSADQNVALVPAWSKYALARLATNSAVAVTPTGTNETIILPEDAGEKLQALIDDLSAAIQQFYSSQKLFGIAFGRSRETGSASRAGLVFYMVSGKTYINAAFAATITDDENGDIHIQIDSEDTSNNFATYASKEGLLDKFKAVADAFNGKYSITTEDCFSPSKVHLSSENGLEFDVRLKK